MGHPRTENPQGLMFLYSPIGASPPSYVTLFGARCPSLPRMAEGGGIIYDDAP